MPAPHVSTALSPQPSALSPEHLTPHEPVCCVRRRGTQIGLAGWLDTGTRWTRSWRGRAHQSAGVLGFPEGPLAVLLAVPLAYATCPWTRVRKVAVTDTTSWRHALRKWSWFYGSMAVAQEGKAARTRGAALLDGISARLR